MARSLAVLSVFAAVFTGALAHGLDFEDAKRAHHTITTHAARADPTSITPLISKTFTYPGNDIPYQVDPVASGRGPQSGYNICNSTTEGTNSQCQTAFLNNIQDFCVWGPPTANTSIGDAEAATVAFCSNPGHGARIMPPGTLTGVQVLKAPAYLLFTGTIVQTGVNIEADDGGGELDPRGADLRGNPLGGLVISNGLPTTNTNNDTYQVVTNWSNFMGSDVFCFKMCDNTVANSFEYCNNIFDETGCGFVAPAAYTEGVFEVCDSDNQDPVGVYTGADGKTSTYSQPAVVVTLPSIRTPSSSNCVTYNSADLYASAASYYSGSSIQGGGSSTTTSSSGGSTATTTTTGSGTSKATSTTKATSSGAGGSTTGSAAPSSTSGAASSLFAGSSVFGGLGAAPALAIAVSVLAGFGAAVAGM